MIVAELMTANPVTVTPNDTLQAACEKMELGRFRQVPVVDQQILIGILTDRDARLHSGQLARVRVDEAMSAHPFSVHPSTPVEKAAHLLTTNKIGSLPVIEHNRLVGIITATDMLKALEALLSATNEGTSRIDLDLDGIGEVSAATSLIRSICPLLGLGTYRRDPTKNEVSYVLVPSTSAESASLALKEHGFRVLAVHG